MTLAYTVKLDFTNQKINIGAQKINGSPQETHNMASAKFLFQDNLGEVRFFEETILLTNTNMEMILKMFFLVFSNINFQFNAKKIT